MRPAATRIAALASAALASALLGGDAYLAAKGALARFLIARATEETLARDVPVSPWPWADFHPVARMEVPRLGITRPVLSGATGAVLAFGLGHVDGTSPPGETGLSVVGGHRDGDARFLARLTRGDVVRVHTPAGTTGWIVADLRVVRADAPVPDPGPDDRLWLVTCWPVDAWTPSPLRYVVEAIPRSEASGPGR